MKLPIRSNLGYGMAFLDVISCGFGALVLLVLISRPGDAPSEIKTDTGALVARTFALEDEIKQLDTLLQQEKLQLAERQGNNADARLAEQRIAAALQAQLAKAEQASATAQSLQAQGDALRSMQQRRADNAQRDVEVGGIPVDSDYVIFIIDTSGSMRSIWPWVLNELDNVLSIHKQVKGFQVMNADGTYLFPGQAGKWIPDRPSWRKRTNLGLRTWTNSSRSNPMGGIERALKTYGGRGKLSLYVFGDDYAGASFDADARLISDLNRTAGSDERLARIHAVGFMVAETSRKFSTLMRAVAYRNDGTFLGLSR